MARLLGLLEKSPRCFQRAALGRGQPFAAQAKNPLLDSLLQLGHLFLQRRRLAGGNSRLQRRNFGSWFFGLGFRLPPSGLGWTAGRRFRLRRRRSRLFGHGGGRWRRSLHHNALVRLLGRRRSRRRGRDVDNLRARLPLGAAAKNNGNAENCSFPDQGTLILSLQQKSRLRTAWPPAPPKGQTSTAMTIGYTPIAGVQAIGNSRK